MSLLSMPPMFALYDLMTLGQTTSSFFLVSYEYRRYFVTGFILYVSGQDSDNIVVFPPNSQDTVIADRVTVCFPKYSFLVHLRDGFQWRFANTCLPGCPCVPHKFQAGEVVVGEYCGGTGGGHGAGKDCDYLTCVCQCLLLWAEKNVVRLQCHFHRSLVEYHVVDEPIL